MAKENLTISQDKIRVVYQFKNTSKNDITTRVAFPLPELSDNEDLSNINPTVPNPFKFSVIVNDKKVNFETETKKRKDGENTLYKITHYWQQTFPAGKILNVVHEYTPATGGAVGYGMQEESSGRYCIDTDLKQWINKQLKAKYDIPTATVNYILSTGANWKGSIGKFKLIIKKSDANEKVSFCGTGTKKIDSKTIVMEKTNFEPKQDLYILYLKKPYKLGD
jgi:hypothetical protein